MRLVSESFCRCVEFVREPLKLFSDFPSLIWRQQRSDFSTGVCADSNIDLKSISLDVEGAVFAEFLHLPILADRSQKRSRPLVLCFTGGNA